MHNHTNLNSEYNGSLMYEVGLDEIELMTNIMWCSVGNHAILILTKVNKLRKCLILPFYVHEQQYRKKVLFGK